MEQLARELGPRSFAAEILAELRFHRAKDRQVYAFRFGNYWVTGPVPDARTEAGILSSTDEDAVEWG